MTKRRERSKANLAKKKAPEGQYNKNKKIKLRKRLKDRLEMLWAGGKGVSRHEVKARMQERFGERESPYIHDDVTLKTYKQGADAFADWCKEKEIEDYDEARGYVGDFLEYLKEIGAAPSTITTRGAALAKIYACSIQDFTCHDGREVVRPKRNRTEITRSRMVTERDKHVSQAHTASLTAFCCATGVRRHEIDCTSSMSKAMRGTYMDPNTGEKKPTVSYRDGLWYVHITGKGGKSREAEIVGDEKTIKEVVARIRSAGDGLVWPKVHSMLDIHSLRAKYAATVYRKYARPLSQLSKQDKYCCRKEFKGKVLDRKAMLKTSQMLGHNRVCIFADHYAWTL